jgi:hypothetical protein
MRICPVWAELFHADRQTDMTNLIVAFRNFATKPKNGIASGGILSSVLRNERQNGADAVLCEPG